MQEIPISLPSPAQRVSELPSVPYRSQVSLRPNQHAWLNSGQMVRERIDSETLMVIRAHKGGLIGVGKFDRPDRTYEFQAFVTDAQMMISSIRARPIVTIFGAGSFHDTMPKGHTTEVKKFLESELRRYRGFDRISFHTAPSGGQEVGVYGDSQKIAYRNIKSDRSPLDSCVAEKVSEFTLTELKQVMLGVDDFKRLSKGDSLYASVSSNALLVIRGFGDAPTFVGCFQNPLESPALSEMLWYARKAYKTSVDQVRVNCFGVCESEHFHQRQLNSAIQNCVLDELQLNGFKRTLAEWCKKEHKQEIIVFGDRKSIERRDTNLRGNFADLLIPAASSF